MNSEDFVDVVAQRLDSWTIALASAASKSGQQWDASQSSVEKAAKAISSAVADALAHVAIVRKNNPAKSWTEIFGRSDVQEALTQPFQDARDTVQAIIAQEWQVGQKAGWAAAQTELKSLGLPVAEMPDLPNSTLASILNDATVNATAAKDRLIAAIVSGDPGAPQKVGNNLMIRAGLGVSTAGQFGYNEAKETAYSAQPNLQKTWVAHFSPTTCKYCTWLHGQTVPVGQPFPLPPGGPVPYTGQLMGPQYHPNCRCTLLPHLEGTSQPEKLQAGALVSLAENDAPPPPQVTSAAIKAIPQSKLAKVLQWLIKWFGGSP